MIAIVGASINQTARGATAMGFGSVLPSSSITFHIGVLAQAFVSLSSLYSASNS